MKAGKDHSAIWAQGAGLLIALLLTSGAAAGSDLAPETPSSLGEALATAEARNPAVSAARAAWEAALQRVGEAGALPDPRLAYAYYLEPVQTRVGPQEHRVGLVQTVPGFGKRGLARTIAGREAERARWQLDQVRREVRLQAARAYANFYYAGRSDRIVRAFKALLEDRLAAQRGLVNAGSADARSVIDLDMALQKVETDLDLLARQLDACRASLRAVLALPASVDLPLPDSLPPWDGAMPPAEFPEERSPVLKASEAAVQAGEDRLALARKRSLPDVALGVDWIFTGDAPSAGSDSGRDAVAATISLNLPLWSPVNRATRAAAAADLASLTGRREAALLQLRAEWADARYGLEDAVRRADLFGRQLLPDAEAHRDLTLKAYEAGDLPFDEWIRSAQRVLDLERSKARAVADLAIAQARIEALAGQEEKP